MDNLETASAPVKTDPEALAAGQAGIALHDDLDSIHLANPLDQALQKQNLEDLNLSADVFNSLLSFRLTPEDKKLFQELSGALQSPDNIGKLRDIRGKLQKVVNEQTGALADLKKHLPNDGTVNADVYEAIDLEKRLDGLGAANELARAAEVALGRNGVALKDAATGTFAALASDMSHVPGGLGPEFAARLNEFGKAIAEFAPEKMGVLNKGEAMQLDNVRFALSEISHPMPGPGIEGRSKAFEALERAAATNSALAAPAKIAAAAYNLQEALDKVLQATESLIAPPPQLPTDLASPVVAPVSPAGGPAMAMSLSAPWMAAAWGQLGQTNSRPYLDTTEVYVDPKYNPAAGTYEDKKLSWCGAFVNWAFRKPGIAKNDLPAESSNANAWLTWGKHIEQPVLGAVGIFLNKGKADHMGLVAGRTGSGKIVVLAGNQQSVRDPNFRGVTYWPNPETRSMEFRLPKDYEPKPADYNLPLMIEREGVYIYAADEIKAIKNVSPQEAGQRLAALLNQCQLDPVKLKAAIQRIWIEAGGKGEPPPGH
jgi:uncharacterized protein (TIGR02594 family)